MTGEKTSPPTKVSQTNFPLETACSIVTQYSQNVLDSSERPVALDHTGGAGINMSLGEAVALFTARSEEEGGDRSQDEVGAQASEFLASTRQNVFEQCPALRKLKDARSFTPDPEGARNPPVTSDGLFFEYYTEVVTLPFVDAEGGRAYMWTGQACGPLCGSSGVKIFARQPDGSWKSTDYMGLTIS